MCIKKIIIFSFLPFLVGLPDLRRIYIVPICNISSVIPVQSLMFCSHINLCLSHDFVPLTLHTAIFVNISFSQIKCYKIHIFCFCSLIFKEFLSWEFIMEWVPVSFFSRMPLTTLYYGLSIFLKYLQLGYHNPQTVSSKVCPSMSL